MPFASRSVRMHYARGIVGLVSLVAAVALMAAGTSVGAALLGVTVAAWRGCPTCWAIGLAASREREACRGGACRPLV